MSRAPFGTLPGEPEVLATIRHLRSEGVPRDEIQAALLPKSERDFYHQLKADGTLRAPGGPTNPRNFRFWRIATRLVKMGLAIEVRGGVAIHPEVAHVR